MEDNVVTNQAEIKAWEVKDIMASNFIYATVSDELKHSLINCETAHQMWERLSVQYLQNASDNKHLLKQQFFQLQFDVSHDVMHHITSIEALAMQLKDLGDPIPEADIVNKVLCTLPPNFRNFITVWDSISDEEKTVSLLTTRLLKEERTNKRYDEHQPVTATEAFASIGHHSSRGQPQSTRGNFRGGRGMHHGRGGPKRPRPVCDYCNIAGHTIHVCRHRIRDEKYNQPQYSQPYNCNIEKQNDFSFKSVFPLNKENEWDWFADSGATQHMSGNKDLFDHIEAIDHDNWKVKGVGGICLPVKGKGTIKIQSNVNKKSISGSLQEVLFVPGLGTNLFSIASATKNGAKVHFSGNEVVLFQNGEIVMLGERAEKGLYHLKIVVKSLSSQESTAFASEVTASLWHERLGHACQEYILKMLKGNFVKGLDIKGKQNTFKCMLS